MRKTSYILSSRVPWVAETLLARFFCFRQVFRGFGLSPKICRPVATGEYPPSPGLWQTPRHGPVMPPQAREKPLVPRLRRKNGAKKKIRKEKKQNKQENSNGNQKRKHHRQGMNPWLPQNPKGDLCNELYQRCLLRAGPFTGSICDFCVGFKDVIVALI